MGKFLSWYLHKQERTVYGMKIPTGFGLIGQTTLEEYEEFLARRNAGSPVKSIGDCSGVNGKITRRAYARVGLMGNPSDGFFGKTISLSIRNFWAEVSISESTKLALIPHPICDPTEFGSLADLYGISEKEGYLGGLRLLQATCKKFYNFCSTHGVALSRRNFTLRYDTNIPRQVGLAGSSALVTATLRCLMDFYCLSPSDIPKEVMPQLILEVEVAELNIQAGLQDRVVQVYEGLVSMNFAEDLMASDGHGDYRNLSPATLPQFFLAYQRDPSDSGRIHSDVRARFDAGDQEVRDAMRQFAGFAEEAEGAIEKEDFSTFADLMEKNFALRRNLYGDECIGKENLKMIDIGQKFEAACKFPGSGGAIVGLLKDQSRFEELRMAYEEEGFVITKVIPNMPMC